MARKGDPRQGRSWDVWGRLVERNGGFYRTPTGRLAFQYEPTRRQRGRLVGDARFEWFGDAPSGVLDEPIHLGWRTGPRQYDLGRMRFAEAIEGSRPGLAFTLDKPVKPELRALLAPVRARIGPAAVDPATLLASARPDDDAPADEAEDAEILLRHLLHTYLGADPSRVAAVADAAIPAALRLVHGVLRNPLPQVSLRALRTLHESDGRVVFAASESGRTEWAWVSTGPDPAVEVRRDGVWRPESPQISAFLIQLLVLGAAHLATYGGEATTLDPQARSRLLRHFTELPWAPWASTSTRFYVGPGRVAVLTPTGPRTWAAEVGAEQPFDLNPIDGLLRSWSQYR